MHIRYDHVSPLQLDLLPAMDHSSPKVKDTLYHVLNVSYVVFDGTVTALLDSDAASKTEAAARSCSSFFVAAYMISMNMMRFANNEDASAVSLAYSPSNNGEAIDKMPTTIRSGCAQLEKIT